MYLLEEDEKATVQLLGSGVILREVIKAAKILREEYQIHSNVYSVTSFNELARDGMACEEYNRLHPLAEDVKEHGYRNSSVVLKVSSCLQPIICVLIANRSVLIFQMVVHS